MKKFLILFYVLLLPFNLFSQELKPIEELIEASMIVDPTERLDAYDSIIKKYYSTETVDSKPTEDIGKWSVSVDTDPLTDNKIIYFMLKADTGTSVYGSGIYLIIRSKNGKDELYINWNSYLGSEASITMRVGDTPAITFNWSLSTDSQASFLPEVLVPVIAEQLTQVDRFVARCIPYGENPITAIFDVRGLKKAAEPYKDVLPWMAVWR